MHLGVRHGTWDKVFVDFDLSDEIRVFQLNRTVDDRDAHIASCSHAMQSVEMPFAGIWLNSVERIVVHDLGTAFLGTAFLGTSVRGRRLTLRPVGSDRLGPFNFGVF